MPKVVKICQNIAKIWSILATKNKMAADKMPHSVALKPLGDVMVVANRYIVERKMRVVRPGGKLLLTGCFTAD